MALAQSLIPQLEPLRPYLGTTWRGEFMGGDTPSTDVQQWQRILNGTAIRIMHSLNNGAYGGETIVYWDAAQQSLAYYYFTTAGFITHGTMTIERNVTTSHEFVEGNTQGITEVKAVSTLRSDGTIHSKSYFLKNGEWVDAHEAVYHNDPTAQLIFQ